MKKELVPNNTTLAGLRGLLREARKNMTSKEAVFVELTMWHYDDPPTGTGAIKEHIGVWRSGKEEGTQNFKSVKKAREWIDSWKEEDNGTSD